MIPTSSISIKFHTTLHPVILTYCLIDELMLHLSCTFQVTCSIRTHHPSRWEEGTCKCGVEYQDFPVAFRLAITTSFLEHVDVPAASFFLEPGTKWHVYGMVKDENPFNGSNEQNEAINVVLATDKRRTLAGTSYIRHARESIPIVTSISVFR